MTLARVGQGAGVAVVARRTGCDQRVRAVHARPDGDRFHVREGGERPRADLTQRRRVAARCSCVGRQRLRARVRAGVGVPHQDLVIDEIETQPDRVAQSGVRAADLANRGRVTGIGASEKEQFARRAGSKPAVGHDQFVVHKIKSESLRIVESRQGPLDCAKRWNVAGGLPVKDGDRPPIGDLVADDEELVVDEIERHADGALDLGQRTLQDPDRRDVAVGSEREYQDGRIAAVQVVRYVELLIHRIDEQAGGTVELREVPNDRPFGRIVGGIARVQVVDVDGWVLTRNIIVRKEQLAMQMVDPHRVRRVKPGVDDTNRADVSVCRTDEDRDPARPVVRCEDLIGPASDQGPGCAHPVITVVLLGTGIAIVTGAAVCAYGVRAEAARRVTGAGVMTLVAGRADDRIRADAGVGLATIGLGTGITVVAGGTVRIRRVGAIDGRSCGDRYRMHATRSQDRAENQPGDDSSDPQCAIAQM